MKTLRFISTFAMLALATVVTAGSMYVTASAAAQQEATDEFNVAPVVPAPVQDTSAAAEVVPVPDVEAALEKLDAALDKTQILRGSQSHIILDENGGFNGRISSLRNADGEQVPVANLRVVLAHHGSTVGSTTTDASGRFTFTGLPEGVVAIWAEGENSLMLFSCVLFGKNSAIPENAGLAAAQVELDMDSAVAFGPDVMTVKELISPYMSMQDKRFANEVAAEDQEFSFGSGDPSTTLRHRRVRLQNDGSLKGEIHILDERTGRHREVLDLTAHFVRNGVRVASSEVSNDGSFVATGLTPGVHSVVAVGQDGVLVCGVDVVGMNYEDNQAEDAGAGEFKPVNAVAAFLDFSGSPVGPGNLGAFSGSPGGGPGGGGAPVVGYPTYTNPGGGGAPGGGGSGGGYGGGGGGFGGGGGLGALLAGGIGGAIGYLVGQNNNDDPASPGI
ncbi:MAG: hypothetical protein H7Z17_07395 [Fuerstia sp.]|nr:hypothetical protein [Fuerstiella sp.]